MTIDFPDVCRRAIRWSWGQTGLATRTECLNWYIGHADADLETTVAEMDEQAPEERQRIEARGSEKGAKFEREGNERP